MSTTDTPPPPPHSAAGPDGPRISGQEARDLGGLRRTTKASPEGRHLAGVAGGLARHFDIDPVIVRVLLVVLVFFGGAGLLLYGAGWLLVPEEGSERATIRLDDRNRSLALYIAGGLAALAVVSDTIGDYDFPWPLAIIGLILLVIFGNRDRIKDPDWRPFAGAQPGQEAGPAAGQAAGQASGTTAPYDDPAATTATGATAGWVAPPAYGPPAYGPPYAPQPNPRRRGPILFWFTLALIALGLGVLGIIDAAPNTSVPDSAYPALAVGVTGAMLVLGAFWGRAGGLILVGLLATVGLVGTTANNEFGNDHHRIHVAPTSAAAVRDAYDFDAGEMVVDLTHVGDPAALDGRNISVEGGVGKISVVVPDDWGVQADTNVGVGSARVLAGGENGGFGISKDGHESGEPGSPEIQLDVHLGIGAIQVTRESAFAWPDHDFSGWSTR